MICKTCPFLTDYDENEDDDENEHTLNLSLSTIRLADGPQSLSNDATTPTPVHVSGHPCITGVRLFNARFTDRL